jgi:flagellar basal body-associated protein FliL
VAEDKKKEADAKAEGGKKRGLSAIVMVAVGAVLGGAGVVFAVPPKKVEVVVEKPPPRIQPIKHPDVVEITFNPQTEAGKGFASIKFKFTYEVREDLEQEAYKQVADNWDRARSNCLFMLGARTSRELGSDSGKRALVKDLTDELDHALFPDDGHKIARVSEVLVVDLMLQ